MKTSPVSEQDCFKLYSLSQFVFYYDSRLSEWWQARNNQRNHEVVFLFLHLSEPFVTMEHRDGPRSDSSKILETILARYFHSLVVSSVCPRDVIVSDILP